MLIIHLNLFNFIYSFFYYALLYFFCRPADYKLYIGKTVKRNNNFKKIPLYNYIFIYIFKNICIAKGHIAPIVIAVNILDRI